MRKFAPILSVLIVLGCGDGPGDTVPETSASSTDGHMPFQLTQQQLEGQQIYRTLCWSCHGVAGRGDGPANEPGDPATPPTFHTLDYARASTESLLRRFRESVGGTDTDHPHMQSVAEMLQPGQFANALSFIPALVYPPEIPGSALVGKTIYDENCASCHGASGLGDGSDAAGMSDVRPADFTTDSLVAAKDWNALFNRIADGGTAAHGSAMPAFSQVLTDNETWDVVAFLATFQPNTLRPPFWLD